jgi:hypothetical protein
MPFGLALSLEVSRWMSTGYVAPPRSRTGGTPSAQTTRTVRSRRSMTENVLEVGITSGFQA